LRRLDLFLCQLLERVRGTHHSSPSEQL